MPWKRFRPPAVETGTNARKRPSCARSRAPPSGPPRPAGTPPRGPPRRRPRGQASQAAATREEIEHGLAGEDGAGPTARPRPRRRTRRRRSARDQQPLEAPPQQDQEQVLRPEVDGEPDELGIEGRDRGRQRGARAPKEPGAREPPTRGAIRLATRQEDLRADLQRAARCRAAGRTSDEVRVEGRVEDHVRAERARSRPSSDDRLRPPSPSRSARRPPAAWPARAQEEQRADRERRAQGEDQRARAGACRTLRRR